MRIQTGKLSGISRIVSPALVICVFFLSFSLPLVHLPHSHGSDLDHSEHQDCPVYLLNKSHACYAHVVFFEPLLMSGGPSEYIAALPLIGTTAEIFNPFSSRAPPFLPR